MAEDIHIDSQPEIPRAEERQKFLLDFSDWTRNLLGGRLTFERVAPFTSRIPGEDDEILPAGFLATAEQARKLWGSRPMDNLTLARCLRGGLERLKVPTETLHVKRTQRGVWIGPETVDRMEAAVRRIDQNCDHIPSSPLGRDVFAEGFLRSQGKVIGRG